MGLRDSLELPRRFYRQGCKRMLEFARGLAAAHFGGFFLAGRSEVAAGLNTEVLDIEDLDAASLRGLTILVFAVLGFAPNAPPAATGFRAGLARRGAAM